MTEHLNDPSKAPDRSSKRDFYCHVIKSMPAICFLLGPDSKLLFWNPAFKTATGFSTEKLYSLTLPELFRDAEQDRVVEAIDKAILDGVINLDVELVSQSGSRAFFHLSLLNTPLDGQPHITGVGNDFTWQVRTEPELQTSQPFLDVVERAPIAVVVMNTDLAASYLNPKFTELFGYTLKDISAIGEWLNTAFPDTAYRKQVRKKWLKQFATLSRKGQAPHTVEVRVRCKDGSSRFIEYHIARVDHGMLLMALDLTGRKQGEEKLRQEKIFADAVIASTPGAFYVIDQHTNYVCWNSYVNDLTGLPDERLMGASALLNIHEEDRALAQAKILMAFATGSAQAELRILTHSYGVRHFSFTAKRFEVDGAAYLAGFGIDVSERKQAEEALRFEKAFSSMLIKNVPGKLCVFDAAGNYVRWNSYLNRLTGLTDEQLLHTTGLLTVAEHDRPTAAEKLQEAFAKGYSQGDLHFLSRDRGERNFFMTIRRFEVDGSSYLATFGIDITERYAMEQELERQAHTDALTGATGRGHCLALAEQELARSRRYGHPLALLMLDIDHFKEVNDTSGHHAGDLALKMLVQVCRQKLRDVDILGRLGGEEFCVLMPETESEQAFQAAERLRQAISEAEVPLEQELPVHFTISIGVAIMIDTDSSVSTLLSRADQALYEAKRTGRNKVCMAEGLAQRFRYSPIENPERFGAGDGDRTHV